MGYASNDLLGNSCPFKLNKPLPLNKQILSRLAIFQFTYQCNTLILTTIALVSSVNCICILICQNRTAIRIRSSRIPVISTVVV